MLSYTYNVRKGPMRFFDANDGGGSGGATGDGPSGGQADANATPFDDIDLDELDEPTKQALAKAKTAFIEQRGQVATLQLSSEKNEQLARRMQSEADRAKAELQRIFGKDGKPPQDTVDPFLETAKAALQAGGYTEADVAKMAPMFATMLASTATATRTQLGKDLLPLAQQVLQQEAQTAFETAKASDGMGVFTTPEVSQKVWDYIIERTKAGQKTTPEIAVNLGRMAFFDWAAAERAAGREVKLFGGEPVATPAPTTAVRTAFSFPGAGASSILPAVPRVADPSAAKHSLNSDTEAALASTFTQMTRGTDLMQKTKLPVGKGGRK